DGPISCGLLCQTFAYGEVAHPASINAVPINHKRTLHQCTPFPVCNLGLFGCKHVRLSDRVPDRRIIRNDHGGSRFKFISEVVSELRAKLQPRCERVGIHSLAFASHVQPSSLFMFRRETARFSSRSFEHGEHMVSKLLASAKALPADFNGRASDRIAVPI